MSLEVRIINATIDIFKEKGVKFTMDDIANNLSVSKRTIYETIESKENLLSALVDEIFDMINEQQRLIIKDETVDDIEKLKRILTVLPTSFNTIDYTRLYEVKKFYPNVYEKIAHRLESGWGPTEKIIDNCVEKGLIKKVDLYLIKSILIGSIRNLLENDYLYKEHVEYEGALRKVVDIMFDGLVIK